MKPLELGESSGEDKSEGEDFMMKFSPDSVIFPSSLGFFGEARSLTGGDDWRITWQEGEDYQPSCETRMLKFCVDLDADWSAITIPIPPLASGL